MQRFGGQALSRESGGGSILKRKGKGGLSGGGMEERGRQKNRCFSVESLAKQRRNWATLPDRLGGEAAECGEVLFFDVSLEFLRRGSAYVS